MPLEWSFSIETSFDHMTRHTERLEVAMASFAPVETDAGGQFQLMMEMTPRLDAIQLKMFR